MKTYTLDEHVAAFPGLSTAHRQRLGVEPNGKPLDDDGVVGARTRSGIFVSQHQEHPLLIPAFHMARVGAREDGGNNCGYFPSIFMGNLPFSLSADRAPTRGKRQGLWCAGFTGWCICEAYGPGSTYSWSAKTLTQEWARGGQHVKLEDAQAGDIICWFRDVEGEPAAGHVGIVVGKVGDLLLVIEGNGYRRESSVGIYGYSLAKDAQRGSSNPQGIRLIARRAA